MSLSRRVQEIGREQRGGRSEKGRRCCGMFETETCGTTLPSTSHIAKPANSSAGGSEGVAVDRLDFFALAERARAKGHRPAALFASLIHGNRPAFITQADEDAAQARLKAAAQEQGGQVVLKRVGWRQTQRSGDPQPPAGGQGGRENELLEDDVRLVRCVMLAARKHGITEPFAIARKLKPEWTLDEWNAAHERNEEAELAKLRDSTAGREELWRPLA